jgi:LemA protein
MTSSQIIGAALAAVMVFWIVGAYNRLVSLRSVVTRSFQPVELQIRHRDRLLGHWLDLLRPLVEQARQSIESVAAACSQLQAALDVVCRRPLAAGPVATLRLAEDTLAAARQRLQAELAGVAPEAAIDDARESLGAADTALVFAYRQFNQATQAYNAARRQFPTWLVAALFGFRAAGTL